jgi:hypothetical protein
VGDTQTGGQIQTDTQTYSKMISYTFFCFLKEGNWAKNKCYNHMLRLDSKKLRITNRKDEEMLDDKEDDGRVVSEAEHANESLPLRG